MHKKNQRRDAHDLSEEEYRELFKQPAGLTQLVVDAVTDYNKRVSLSRDIEGKNVDDLVTKEAEENAAKVFLDEIFDIVEQKTY